VLTAVGIAIFLFIVLLVFGLLYSPPSAWIGRGKDRDKSK
jgi:hypothetical protein